MDKQTENYLIKHEMLKKMKFIGNFNLVFIILQLVLFSVNLFRMNKFGMIVDIIAIGFIINSNQMAYQRYKEMILPLEYEIYTVDEHLKMSRR
jgi:hypothetical protein